MDRVCSQCHALVFSETDTCPACGGAVILDSTITTEPSHSPRHEVDHRGIVLPPRHTVGGVITPR